MRLTSLLLVSAVSLAATTAFAKDTTTKTEAPAAKPAHHHMHHHKGMHGTTNTAPAAEPAYQSRTEWPIMPTNPNHPLAPAGAW